MQDNNQLSQTININFIAALRLIFANKFMIFLIMLLSLIMSAISFVNTNSSLKVELNIFKSDDDSIKFTDENSLRSLLIDEDYLFDRFSQLFLEKKNTLDIIETRKSLYHQNINEFNLEKEAAKFKLLGINDNSNLYQVPEASIIYQTNYIVNNQNILNILNYLIIDLEKKVKKTIMYDIEKYIEETYSFNNKKINLLQIEKDNLFSDKIKEWMIQRLFLENNFEIAKKLGLSENSINNISSLGAFYFERTPFEIPYYFYGTVTIEHQINSLNNNINNINKDNAYLYSDDILEIDKQIRAINQSNEIFTKETEKFYNESKLITDQDNFKTIIYDINEVLISVNLFDRLKMSLIYLFIGIIISSLYLTAKVISARFKHDSYLLED